MASCQLTVAPRKTEYLSRFQANPTYLNRRNTGSFAGFSQQAGQCGLYRMTPVTPHLRCEISRGSKGILWLITIWDERQAAPSDSVPIPPSVSSPPRRHRPLLLIFHRYYMLSDSASIVEETAEPWTACCIARYAEPHPLQ